MATTALDRAERLFAAGRYSELIPLLEPQVPVYRESSRFYYLLGASCLRGGDAGGAFTYLKRAEQLAPENPDIELALAALHVRRGETEKAVASYLAVLERKPGHRGARRALAILRKESAPEALAALVESGRIAALYPRSNRMNPRLVGLLTGVALCAAVAAGVMFLGPTFSRVLAVLTSPRIARPEVAAVSLNAAEKAAPVTTDGSFRYLLTDRQTLADFAAAKAYFQQYRDDAALVEINRLLGSNASAAIKDKARTLKSFVGAPDFRTVRDAPTFFQVAADPFLYDGCSVIWRGMAANVRPQGNGLAFDFLVGYDEKKNLEGIVPSLAGGGIPVLVDRPLEVLGVLRSSTGTVRLEVAAIHELLRDK
ncbi:MAG: tetratricopeptide repeat protein [Treponema sp.]|nr:tetratricopeptide repeat protein [Treponema sp.]